MYNAKQLQHSLSGLSEQYENASKYLNLLDIETEFLEGGDKPFSNGDIEVNNLSFSYNDNDDRNATLHNISLTIPQNKRVAFVGHSGSGKSTIIKLILRAFDYDNGSIKIGGAELKDLDIIDFRQHTGYVQQHVELLDDTLKNNLLIGVDDKTMRKLIKSNKLDYLLDKVCKIAKIDQFYNRLGDKGLECIVGEKGVRLSGGEVQRVGIARAIIRDPEILILDEATSSLDSINEHFITEAVDAVSKNRTTIIIAHRLSTIIKSDIIFVLSKGNIVGQGTHNTLLKSCPEYKELVEHQEFVN
ncbi:MAG: ATP-binding cassette domain-containing protein [Cyanobium sp. MAG06]|nr:ATP-binding cassette domain-containing protein [Cyanobium sp. MAG06]